MFAEVAPGIYRFEHRVAEGKNALVCGRRGALAIDWARHHQCSVDELKRIGERI